MICPDCGDEADDFGPCNCAAGGSTALRQKREFGATPRGTVPRPNGAGAMREMVKRKLAKRAGEKRETER